MKRKIIDKAIQGKQMQGVKIQIEEAVNDIEIEMVKIFGNLIGTDEKIEMVMSKDVFFEWAEKIHDMDDEKFDKWARQDVKRRKEE